MQSVRFRTEELILACRDSAILIFDLGVLFLPCGAMVDALLNDLLDNLRTSSFSTWIARKVLVSGPANPRFCPLSNRQTTDFPQGCNDRRSIISITRRCFALKSLDTELDIIMPPYSAKCKYVLPAKFMSQKSRNGPGGRNMTASSLSKAS